MGDYNRVFLEMNLERGIPSHPPNGVGGVTFKLHFPLQDPTFQRDPALLEQVLINLLKNAMDAVRDTPDPQIDLRAQKLNSGKTILQVADNGTGIEPENLEQIFVPFYTTKAEGSGIGLSLSRQIMRMHKGTIELQSAPGEGTVVRLTL